ncbi:hypothetical protein [Ruminococcus sp. JL13D9]|uniref:hypothetical protein n=1 Tax=Ruminococcus sp. JL13D9 TaxID=3233381 RepID=UPI002E9A5DE4|nr:hypothetical protein [Ruminococcus sp.]
MVKTACSAALLTLCLVFGLMLFSGCGDNAQNNEIVGKWVPATATINGETVQFGELNTDSDKFGFVFESNGSCEITIAGTKNSGTYTFNETSVDVEYGGKSEKLRYSDGMLTLNFNYNNETTSFVFTKATETN